ncbi:non-ribosomal peptide synthetase [Micromonospora sp. WMMD882]|uniref:non-ribosomal peptide synthetase n=1 Tax=Micromonospora sp. WMMD882 TaxID=3015151 RepID=UPI00248AF28E|nr:non-ribosomal peptide synthetase [Micromonospora sp. WMMD882]WBB78071.1 non-ribosomal peptide synthetase [Micromonospora sp. WMMD882]
MSSSTLADRLARTVAGTPDAVALRDGRTTLTYRQLWERTATIGAALRARLGKDGMVALLRPRDLTQALVLVACVRDGLPVLVLDPGVPVERLRQIVAPIPEGVVVAADDAPGPRLGPGWTPADLPTVDGGSGRLDGGTGPVDGDRHDPIVVIATSGSSGRPKLVALEHAGLDNRIMWAVREFDLTRRDVFVHCSAPGFDFGLFEVLCPLVLGATLVLPDPDAHRDPEALLAAVREHAVTVLHGTPSLLRQLSRLPGLADTNLRIVFSGGEALTTGLAATLARATGAEVVNEYGPTETTVDSLAYRCPADGGDGDLVPLGVPIDRTGAYVADPDAEGRGELLIGGAGVARGYYGDPRATAAAFVPDESTPGGRRYRTGDLVRRDGDGLFHFLGRGDDQIKVRGVRIELAEVRAAYRRHPLVLDVVAGGVTTPDGTRLAVAVEVADDTVPAAELRRFTGVYLPRAFQPDRLDVTESLPRLPNGKVDRQAVERGWAAAFADVPEQPAAPRARTAEVDLLGTLLRVAGEELGLERVEPSDDFFALGGHSLLAGRVVSVVEAETGRSIPLRAFFNASSFAEIIELTEAGWARDGV